jgi:hypothetical protein
MTRSKCQIDDVVDTTPCQRGDDFSKNVFAFKRVRSNCGTEYRRKHPRVQVASERDGATRGVNIGIMGRAKNRREFNRPHNDQSQITRQPRFLTNIRPVRETRREFNVGAKL